MAFLEKDLIVKDSKIPGSGKGLFTAVSIAKGTRIVEYKGRILTWKEARQSETENPYLFYISPRNVIDARGYKKALGRYVNDARGAKKIKGLKNNCEYVIEKGKVYIDAMTDIPAGSELFVSYGKEYWDIMKENAGK